VSKSINHQPRGNAIPTFIDNFAYGATNPIKIHIYSCYL
jgi:hypothetical protein